MLLACSKDDKSTLEPELKKIIVFKNQTGDLNADALQAQYKENDFTLNFYGSFDSNREPLASKSITYQRTNNDTIVNLIFNSLTNKIASAYITVKSVKQPIVIKFDYLANSTKALNVSFHNYDWNTNTSEVIYSTQLNNENGVVTENPYYASRKALGGISFGDALVGGVAGIAVAETVALVVGGFSGIGALSGAAATVVAAVSPVVIVVGVGIAALAIMVNNANASELIPTDKNYPSTALIQNPIVNPTLSLKEIDCSQTNISFNAGMDSKGSILISGVSGGQPPYSYLVNSGFQSSEFFLNNYQDGSYLIAVKDANGCLGSKLIPLTRCDKTSLAVSIVKNVNSATASAKGGEPPYTYMWSNGSTNSSINNVAKGTYSVTATDAVGCKKLETVSIDSELAIGQNYQGGIIAYIYQIGQLQYIEGETHGIIISSTIQSTAENWQSAMTLCNNLTLNGYSDWVLPPFSLSGYLISRYGSLKFWTSQELVGPDGLPSGASAVVIDSSFVGGGGYVSKSFTNAVIAIRYF
jgi:hypothetical protein